MGLPRTIVPASMVNGVGSPQVWAPSVETRATIRDVDQVAPWRVTLKSQTGPSGACQATALPSGHSGWGVIRAGADHLVAPFRSRAPYSVPSVAYSPEPP